MLDSLGYKCVPLSEVPPVIRLSNEWPELPPEVAGHAEQYNWEEMFPKVKRLYDAGVTFLDIMEKLNIVSCETLRRNLRVWIKAGRLIERPNPRRSGRWREEYNDRLRDWLFTGGSTVAFAKELGFSKDVIQKRAHRLGFVAITKGVQRAHWVLDNSAESVV